MPSTMTLVSAVQLFGLFSSVLAIPSGSQARDTSFASASKEQTYDYIIVGGGISGLTVANRLSEDSKKSVLVIEDGLIDNSPATSVPYLAAVASTANRYSMNGAKEPFMLNHSYPVLVGDVVGGGSVINGMLWDRGSNADYDAWEELGNEGWGWEGMKKYFIKSTNLTVPSESSRKEYNITYDISAYGNKGPVQVSIPSYQWPDIKKIFNSFRLENIPMPQEGFSDPIGAFWCPNDIDNATATRSHARIAYYDPVQNRTNLKLLTGTRVNRVLIENSYGGLEAKGVQMVSKADGSVAEVYARKEVILAAGGVFTPHLLMLSGIGPKAVLAAANITVKKDTPAVGSNFQDHPALTMLYNLSNQSFPNLNLYTTNATFLAEAEAEYNATRTGPWSYGRGDAAAFLTLKMFSPNYKNITARLAAQDPLAYLPDTYSKHPQLLAGFKKQREMLINQFLGDNHAVGELPIQAWGRATAALQKPLSRGTVVLNTTHPEAAPIVTWHALQNPIDSEVICDLVRWNRNHWARKELSQYNPIENAPGAQYQTNEEIIAGSITGGSLAPTFAHTSCGCPMMPEKLGGCVSDKLLVYGVQKLSIVDASIIPMIPATHLQATMYAIGEKAADLIKARG
ncbi:choline dehydrogenase-like protein [Tricladium varicosporioides]|nr:choline dehydrogenase-like protein [Hymenoscyphus varicosporioides]